MLWGKQLDELTWDDIDGLVTGAVPEDQHIDFKEDLPDLKSGKADRARKELARDFAALANATGGDLVFGVREGRDPRKQPNGTAVSINGGGEIPNGWAIRSASERWSKNVPFWSAPKPTRTLGSRA